MYFLTAAAAAVIGGGVLSPILPSVVGVIWGWTVAGGAFLPYALLVLVGGRLCKAVLLTLFCAAAALVPMALVDHHFYGRWTVRAELCNGHFCLSIEAPRLLLCVGMCVCV